MSSSRRYHTREFELQCCRQIHTTKEWHGLRRFRLKGLEKVNAEALMNASGQNLKRLVDLGGRSPKRIAMVAALGPSEKLSPHPIRRHRTIPAWHFSTSWRLPRTRVNKKRRRGGR